MSTLVSRSTDESAAPRFAASPSAPWHRLRAWKERCLLSAARSLRRLGARLPRAFGVVTYHRVADEPRVDPAMLNVTPRRFRQQLEGLIQLGYEPWALRRAVDYMHANEPIPREAFVVVFDDGFQSVYQHAWPVLRDLHVPATIFLATGYLDQPASFPFDTWSAPRGGSPADASDLPLTRRQCREMQDSGLVDLGSHTHTHQDFRGRADALRADMHVSVEYLKSQFGVASPTFSFPYGFTDAALQNAVRQAGVCCALTAECELIEPDQSPFAWGRFGATQFDSAFSLAGKLDGWYSFVRKQWRRVKRGDTEARDGRAAPN